MILDAHGIRLALPARWSGRLSARAGGIAVLHAGSYAIPLEDSSTFGDASTSRMPTGGAFVALIEYLSGPKLVPGRGLFAPRRIKLDPTMFSEHRLAHPRTGQVGAQHFFTEAGRPFCLYVVLATARRPGRTQLAAVSHVLSSLEISDRGVLTISDRTL